MNRLPMEFQRRVIGAYGDDGKRWMTRIPDLVGALCRAIGFEPDGVAPDSSCHFLVKGKKADGVRGVLKLGPPAANMMREARWLKAFPDLAPKVLAVDDSRSAYLMEEISPGEPVSALVKRGDDEGATRAMAEVIRSIRASAPAENPKGFPTVAELADHLDSLEDNFPSALLAPARALWEALTADKSENKLLHGDLHQDNVLSSGEGWKVIDPYGCLGPAEFEVAPMLWNPSGIPVVEQVDARLKILHEVLGYDLGKMKAWGFCRGVLALAWCQEDGERFPPHVLAVVEKLAGSLGG